MRYALIILTIFTAPALAKNVDLSTVPDRATVQLTIYNSEDITLVRETRTISFREGNNPLQFSWANTLIDPTSVELRFVTRAAELEVLDTTFPHDKPQMLYWNVASEYSGDATIEITYFTSGITWSADYVCIAGVDEQALDVEGFVRVHNNSGEEYEDAQVRLVVGKINLVEKIAQLAQVRMEEVAKFAESKRRDLGRRAMMRAVDEAAAMPTAADAAGYERKGVIKEGLSEYFIYTIEGTETIPNGWSKRLRSFDAGDVPMNIQYRYRPQEYGDQLVRLYLLANDEASGLGETPLPDGQVRIFRRNDRGGLSFVAAQHVKYVAIDDKIELNLGVDPDVVFELIPLRAWRDNLWMRFSNTDVIRRVDDGDVRIHVNSTVHGWDEHMLFTQRIRNYTGRAIEVEVRRAYDGHVFYRSSLDPVLHDYRTVQYTQNLGAGEKADLLHEVVVRHGYNAKQNNVTLERAALRW